MKVYLDESMKLSTKGNYILIFILCLSFTAFFAYRALFLDYKTLSIVNSPYNKGVKSAVDSYSNFAKVKGRLDPFTKIPYKDWIF